MPREPGGSGVTVTGGRISANSLASACLCQELNPCPRCRLAGGSSPIGESGRTHQRVIKMLCIIFIFLVWVFFFFGQK